MGGRSQSRGIGISQAQEPGARSPRLAASTPRTVIASPAVTRGSTLDTRASEVRSQSRGIGISQAQASGVRSQESGARRPTFAASEVRTPTTVAAAPLVTQRSTSDTRAHASEARGRNPGSSESTGTTRTAPLILTGRKDAARSQSSGQTGWRPLVSQPTPTTPTMSRPESSARASRWTISRSQDHPAQAAIHQQMEPVRLAPTARETAASPPRHSRAEESAAHRERPRYEAGRSAESAVAASAPRSVASMPSFQGPIQAATAESRHHRSAEPSYTPPPAHAAPAPSYTPPVSHSAPAPTYAPPPSHSAQASESHAAHVSHEASAPAAHSSQDRSSSDGGSRSRR